LRTTNAFGDRADSVGFRNEGEPSRSTLTHR
jgi:hypothetical protein